MKQHERADALLEFRPTMQRSFTFTLVLTLTAADHCFIMDIAQKLCHEHDRIITESPVEPCVKRLVIENC
jgi:hypothetical protein